MSKNKTLRVISKECISCGACIAIGEGIFKFDEESHSIVEKQPENDQEWSRAQDAVGACPVNIIFVDEGVKVIEISNDNKKIDDNSIAA